MKLGIKPGGALRRILERHLLITTAVIAGLCLVVAAGLSQTGRHSSIQLSTAVISRVRGGSGGDGSPCAAAIVVPKVRVAASCHVLVRVILGGLEIAPPWS